MTEQMTSNKPYLIKAFYDWISDNQLTPYIVVEANIVGVMVPSAFVKEGQIVLNISSSAVGAISLGAHAIEFSARFGGKLENLYVPYGAIGAIYAKENGAGTALPIEDMELEEIDEQDIDTEEPAKPKAKGKPSLKVVK